MPTTLSSPFQTALATSAALSLAVRIVRKDGTVHAFSNHTRQVTLPEFTVGSITVPETTYLSGEARFPTNLQKSDDIRHVDNWEFIILLGDSVTEAAIKAGLFLGTAYTFLIFDRANLDNQAILLRGKVGEASLSGLEAKLSMRGLGQSLQQEILTVTSPTSEFGWDDPQLAFFSMGSMTADGYYSGVEAYITSVDPDYPTRRFTVADIAAFPARRFVGGKVSFGGVTVGIQQCVAGVITLDSPAVFEEGDGIGIEIGPPKTLADWILYFGEGLRFPAFPSIPTLEAASAVTG